MYTSAELQMLRNADPGAVIPGIDTSVGNPLSGSSMIDAKSLTRSHTAPVYYDPVQDRVVVTQAGAVLSGINFGDAWLQLNAGNVTVKDCSFTGTVGTQGAIFAVSGSNETIENCTFTGPTTSTPLTRVLAVVNGTIADNKFINSPCDAVWIWSGTVTGNYFSGGGYQTNEGHADAITVNSANGVSITDNFIDWTPAPGAAGSLNDAIRITANNGNCSNVTVSGNFLLGGSYSVDAGNQALNYGPWTGGTFSNINVSNNYMGFSRYSAFNPGTAIPNSLQQYAEQGVTATGNVNFDFRNSALSQAAWTAYQPTITTTNTFVSTGSDIGAASSGSSTLYGAGNLVHLWGGNGLAPGANVFVGGYGTQYENLGMNPNIVTELAISDSTSANSDAVNYFDQAKDVIDLSKIDANLTAAGLQNFTFIGTAPFSGSGAQVRYQQDPASGKTYVQADLAGDASTLWPDLQINLSGLYTLTAANFALSASQSSADLAAANGISISRTRVGNDLTYNYSNISGKNYSSMESYYSNEHDADELNYSSTSDGLVLTWRGATISRGGGTESLTVGTHAFATLWHQTETIDATNAGQETFSLGSNFGNLTIQGFAASGANADTIKLQKSAFSYLTPGMSQAQDLAAVLQHSSAMSAGLVISDTHGDRLTLAGLAASALAASPHIQFV